MSEELHPWFDADGFRVDTEQYGTVDLWVVGGDMVEEDVYVRGTYEGIRWRFPLEGDCGEHGYRAFSAALTQTPDEDKPLLSIAEFVETEPMEYEDLTFEVVEVLEDDDA